MTTAAPPEQPPHDTGYAPPRWAFDDEVTRCFEDMLWRSIPGYPIMRELVTRFAAKHRRAGTTVLDLGCSRGGAIAELLKTDDPELGVRYLGVEVSDPMIEAARARFVQDPMVTIAKHDLRRDFPDVARGCSVVLAVLTLQFIPIEHRARVVRRAAESLRGGDVMVVVEKVLGATSWADDQLVTAYYDHKRDAGYSQEEIDRKRLSLEGVLVPQTEEANVAMLRAEGFRDVTPFWRHLNFAGWLAQR